MVGRAVSLNLKPCPFCKEPGRIVLSLDRLRTYARVECTGCEARTKVVMGDQDGSLAVEIWNSRV